MMHAAPAPLPHNAAGIVRLLSDQHTSGRASWNVVVKKDGTRYRLDYAWKGSAHVSIHVIFGKREVWAATRGTKAQYVCSRTQPAPPVCKKNPTVSQVTPVFLAFSWFLRPELSREAVLQGHDEARGPRASERIPVACLKAGIAQTCVTAFGAPTLLVTPQVRLVARSVAAKPRAADFAKPKIPKTSNDPVIGLYA